MALGLDKRLADAARRVASRMPKHMARHTEDELLDLVKRQNNQMSHDR